MLRGRGIPEEYAIAFLPLILFIFVMHASRFVIKGGQGRPKHVGRGWFRRWVYVPPGEFWKWVFVACVVWAIGACIWIYATGQTVGNG